MTTLSSKVTCDCSLQIFIFDYIKPLEQPMDGELARENLGTFCDITKGLMCVSGFFFYVFLHKSRTILIDMDLWRDTLLQTKTFPHNVWPLLCTDCWLVTAAKHSSSCWEPQGGSTCKACCATALKTAGQRVCVCASVCVAQQPEATEDLSPPHKHIYTPL